MLNFKNIIPLTAFFCYNKLCSMKGGAPMVSINLGSWNGIFAVPNAVVDDCLKLAGSAGLKVLLYLLRHCGESFDRDVIAAAAGISPDAVDDALLFWCEVGVLTQQNGEYAPSSDKKANADHPASSAAPPPQPAVSTATASSEGKASVVSLQDRNVSILASSPPRPTAAEIDKRKRESSELRFLLSEAERCLARPITSSDQATIVSLFDWAKLPADVILMIITYCTLNEKNSPRQIEITAKDFLEHGIDTHEKADRYLIELSQRRESFARISQMFGISGRKLTSKEKNFIQTWRQDLGLSYELIEYAYETCIDHTSKLSFPYINRVLLSFSANGIRDVEAAKRASAAHKERRVTRAHSFDIDQMERDSYNLPPPIYRNETEESQ